MLHSKVRRGELDREVTFIKKVISVGDANADHVDSWIEVTTDPTVSARKKDLNGQDMIVGEQIVYSQRTVWTIDYREDLTTENRLVYNQKVFAILSITDNESGRETYLDVMTSRLNTELWT